jgi:hypothetical protein
MALGKHFAALVLAALTAVSMSGCIVYRGYHQWGYEPQVAKLKSPRYEVLGQAEAKVSNFSLLWVWSVTRDHDYDRAIREMISEKGGDDVIELSFWVDKQHWLLGTVTVMRIRGTVIRYVEE